ncbi:MAG: hypothetical protein Q8R40_02165 [bacterium]|nr:hypothetical protein [bacterium]
MKTKLELTWSNLQSLDQATISSQSQKAGVYRLSYKSADGSFYVFYVGNAPESLRDSLMKHISEIEDNICIKTTIKNLECYFKISEVSNEEDRLNIVKTIGDHFKPKCNLQKLEGETIEINLN